MSETTEISALELWKRLHDPSGPAFFILDVRNEDEARGWKVEGFRQAPAVEIPYFEFIDDEEKALAKVPDGLGEAVVICAKGGSSDFVAGLLRAANRPAVNLAGGMIAWGDLHVPLRVPLAPEDEGRFELWQFNRYGKGCLSYGVVAGGEMAVVDASRFPEPYEAFARERGLRIVEVLDTHVHADHLSGGPALARLHGARYRVLNANGPEPTLEVPVTPLDGGTPIRIGGERGVTLEARALRTPGHTPGSTCFLVGDRYLLSGDTIFVQGVGRPDLGGHLEEWGRQLFATLHQVVAALPDDVQVLPAHFAGACEAAGDGLVRGRLGDIRALSPELAIDDADEFVARIKANAHPAPEVYGRIVQANLGLGGPADADQASEWELGKNECAASAGRARASI